MEARDRGASKTCERCGVTFARNDARHQTLASWEARRFCSRKCSYGPWDAERRVRSEVKLTLGGWGRPLRHGTTYSYQQGCRCDVCRDFHSEYEKARRARRAALNPKIVMVPVRPLLSDLDRAYLAGLFDGEGSVGAYEYGVHHSLTVSVNLGNTNEEVVRLCHQSFGGHVSYRAPRPHAQGLWKWHASGRNAHYALETLLPYLKIKREQAVEALRLRVADYGRSSVFAPEELAERLAIGARLRSMKKGVAS